MDDEIFEWDRYEMLEVELRTSDDFLKIKESLTRIGILSKKSKTLYQSCNILHKQGKYYICHFKEVMNLDGKQTNLSYDDIERRNAIANLLEQWQLCKIAWKDGQYKDKANMSNIKILTHKEKSEYELVAKVTVGKFRN